MPRTADPETRTRLLDAADRLLARHGFRRMTIEAVAAEAGIGKGSVYLHFPSKEEVALTCIDRMADGIVARLERLATGEGMALARLRAMLRLRVLDRFDYARRHARSIDEKLAVMREGLLARRNRHFAREAELLSRVVGDGVRRGDVRPVRPERVGRALVEATNALLPYSLSVRELGRRGALVRRLDDVVELLVAGLAQSAAPRRARSSSMHSSATRRTT